MRFMKHWQEEKSVNALSPVSSCFRPALVPGEALPQPDPPFPFSVPTALACLVPATQMTGKKYAIGMQPVPSSQNFY